VPARPKTHGSAIRDCPRFQHEEQDEPPWPKVPLKPHLPGSDMEDDKGNGIDCHQCAQERHARHLDG
jgi:hypothetical protein